MNASEIIAKSIKNAREYGASLEFVEYNELFASELNYTISFSKYKDPDYFITPEILELLEHFHLFSSEDIGIVKKNAFEHAKRCMAITDYGTPQGLLDKYGNDYLLANMESLGISNEDEAYNRMKLTEVFVQEIEDEGDICTSLSLCFSVPWDTEHGIRFLYNAEGFSQVA